MQKLSLFLYLALVCCQPLPDERECISRFDSSESYVRNILLNMFMVLAKHKLQFLKVWLTSGIVARLWSTTTTLAMWGHLTRTTRTLELA